MTSNVRTRRRTARSLGVALCVVLATVFYQPANAAPPEDKPGKGPKKPPVTQPVTPTAFDYTQVQGLTTDQHPTVKESLRLPMHDGTEVYVEVTRPAGADGQPLAGPWPVILEASHYHGTLADRRAAASCRSRSVRTACRSDSPTTSHPRATRS